jgi:hypothetical protein
MTRVKTPTASKNQRCLVHLGNLGDCEIDNSYMLRYTPAIEVTPAVKAA